jgi:hypothetical protein
MLAGCAQNRYVLNPQVHDMMTGAPEWAQANSRHATETEVFFVGVSEEQVAGEAEAVNQAYNDALRKVADASGGCAIVGEDRLNGEAATGTKSRWPHQSSKRLAFTGVGVGGPAGYAWSNGDNGIGAAAGVAGVFHLKKPQYKRDVSSSMVTSRASQLLREQVLSQVNVVDTWSVAERFSRPRSDTQLNEMQYGELWKAKVLVSVPQKVLEQVAEDQYEMRQRELKQDFEVRKTRSDMEANEMDFDLSIRKRSAERLLEPPTFSFMNNTYWYGYVPTDKLFHAKDYGEFETKNPTRRLTGE